MKNKIHNLSSQVDYWKDKFMNIVDHFKERTMGIFEKDKQDKYKIDKKTYNQMLNKNQKNKDDDFEIKN